MQATTNNGLLVSKLARLVEGSDVLIANTARLVAGARLLGLPVVWLEQNPDRLGATGWCAASRPISASTRRCLDCWRQAARCRW